MSRRHKKLDNRRWRLARLAAFKRDGWRCTNCGKAGRLEAHHAPSLRNGADPYAVEGLRTLCRQCHIDRHRGENRRPLTPAETDWHRFVDSIATR